MNHETRIHASRYPQRLWPAITGAITLLVLLLATARPAHAANIQVNSNADTVANNGACTLREAIINANEDDQSGSTDCAAGSGADAITFAANYTITLGSELPTATTEITITGNGPANTIIQANAAVNVVNYRVFANSGTLTLQQMTVRNGVCSDSCNLTTNVGGNVFSVSGTLNLNNVTLSGGRAILGGSLRIDSGTVNITNSTITESEALIGGGLHMESGTTTITRSIIQDNHAVGDGNAGGGIYRSIGNLTITDSLIDANTAGVGGGVYLSSGDETTLITGSTISGNEALATTGGGVIAASPLALVNSTVSGNSSAVRGAGVVAFFTTASVTNTTFYDNNTDNSDAAGLVNLNSATITIVNSLFVRGTSGANCNASAGADSMSDDTSCGGATQKTTAEINLGPLQDNGGPTLPNGGATPTHALLVGSHAIDFDLSASCTAAPVNGIDQRGLPRNVDVPGTGNDGGASLCDVGAYESVPTLLTVIKDTIPNGPQDFDFRVTDLDSVDVHASFSLDDDDDATLGNTYHIPLEPGNVTVAEGLTPGWFDPVIECVSTVPDREFVPISDGGLIGPGLGRSFQIIEGEQVTCTFTNQREPIPSFCPAEDEAVGNAVTDLIGTGQGNTTKGFRTRKLVVPNSDEVIALYGQLAAVDVGVMKYVRFLPQGYPKVQVYAPTSPAYRTHAVDWWGSNLPTDADWIKGQFFWGAKANKAPRAFVLWPTYETAEPYANVFVTFNESSENHVAAEAGWFNEQTHVLSIPETQGDGATVVVRLAIVDNNKDTRPVWLSVTVGDQSQGNEDTVPNAKDTLNLYEFTFEDVPAGVNEVTIRLESPPPGELALLGGDSAAIIGAAVNYACDIPVR